MMKKLFYIILLVVVLGCMVSAFAGSLVALAETTSSGNVFDDLSRDESFDWTKYPAKNTGRDMSLITIAESVDGELVLYVYQSNTNVTYYAKTVRMCTQLNSNNQQEFGNTTDYPLMCLNHRGVFYKYVVLGYSVADSSTRYYNIVQLMRAYVSGVDVQSAYNDTINAVPVEVAKQYTFTDTAGGTTISEKELEVVRITSEYCGFVRYTSQGNFSVGALAYEEQYHDRYFAAISTDKRIDDLLEAKVSYFKIPVRKIWSENYYRFGVSGITVETLYSAGQRVYTSQDSKRYKAKYGSRTYTWHQIQTVSAFLSSLGANYDMREGVSRDVTTFVFNPVSAERLAALEGMTWVLNYAETDSYYQPTAWSNVTGLEGTSQYEGETVTNMTILEFAFMTDGEFYRLGVVNGERSAPTNTDDNNKFWGDGPQSTEDVLKAIILLVGVALLVVAVTAIVVKVVAKAKQKR